MRILQRLALNYEKKQTKVKELTKMPKMILLFPISFSFWWVDYALEVSKF